MTATATIPLGLLWKLRRVAADLRQQDVSHSTGITTSHYSAMERGEEFPSELERELIEKALPQLPAILQPDREKAHRRMT